MAKFIFSEVRAKTATLDKVAGELIKEGHQVIWVVQNHLFNPSNYSKKYLLSYPSKRDIDQYKHIEKPFFKHIRACDRMLLYFNHDGSYYGYYYKLIEDIYNNEAPDYVIGEVGNFHTHMLCMLCRETKIPFYDIVSSRYPLGRISFHLYDEYNPVVINSEDDQQWDESYINSLVESISFRNIKPDYMKWVDKGMWRLKVKRLPYRFRLLLEYLRGERFCTHNPLVYLNRRIKIAGNLSAVKRSAKGIDFFKNQNKKILLFPMQMQPELNLDVWGNRFRDQEKLVKEIASVLPYDWILVVKINPKAREDLNNDLAKEVNELPNTYFVNPLTDMKEIDEISDCAITVTGTIALERIIRGEPVIILANSFLVKEKFGVGVDRVEAVGEILENFNREEFVKNQIDGYSMVKELLKRSMPGRMGSPLTGKSVIESSNINSVTRAVKRVIN
ncbi:hypothetical protein QA597_09160 [Marinilabiliaceae bacterium ANBcel2]|nr:hypothetical protein [Marinilabiliaceae bacterium ANBcel2]